MDKHFWEEIKEKWIHTPSLQENENIETALLETDKLFTSHTETQYGKNFLLDEE